LGFALGIGLCGGLVFGSEATLIQVRLFRGTWPEGQDMSRRVEVLTASARPELAAAKEKIGVSDGLLTAAAIEALFAIYDLQAVEDIFLHEKWWDGKNLHHVFWDGNVRPEDKALRKNPFDNVVHGIKASFQIDLTPMELPDRRLSLLVVISSGRSDPDRASGETGVLVDHKTVLDQEIALEIGDLAVIGAPWEGGAYFAVISAVTGNPAGHRPAARRSEEPRRIYFGNAPKALSEIRPAYPEELRRCLIGGEMVLVVAIDDNGAVQKVDIERPLHPYLNYSAVQAVRQASFEPLRFEGKPVPAAFRLTYAFHPRVHAPGLPPDAARAGPADPSSVEELREALRGGADYCRRLAEAVYSFVCEESIRETHYGFRPEGRWSLIAVTPRTPQAGRSAPSVLDIPDERQTGTKPTFGADEGLAGSPRPRIVAAIQKLTDPGQNRRNNFLCDYQIIKKAGVIKERRFLLKDNGRKVAKPKKVLEETRFSAVSSILAPLRVLSADKQPRFDYRIAGEEKVDGKPATVIEARPKSIDEDGIWSAKIWLDKKSFQVRKSEIEGVPVEGFEDVLEDSVHFNIKPSFVMSHEYRTGKGGILFPSRSRIRAAYPGLDPAGPLPKDDIILTYNKFKYFTVETGSQIIK